MTEQDQTKSAPAEDAMDKQEAKAKVEETKVEVTKAPADAEAIAGKEEAPKEEKKEKSAFTKASTSVKTTVDKSADKPAPSGKFANLIKQIEELKVSELAELVKALEERFGVSAAMPVAAGAPAAVGVNAQTAEEKTEYTVVLAAAGEQKINVIKAVREINQDLGLKEAKDLVEAAPKEVKKNIPVKEAQEAKKKLEAAGAKVELK